jgi:hypothetical protein
MEPGASGDLAENPFARQGKILHHILSGQSVCSKQKNDRQTAKIR